MGNPDWPWDEYTKEWMPECTRALRQYVAPASKANSLILPKLRVWAGKLLEFQEKMIETLLEGQHISSWPETWKDFRKETRRDMRSVASSISETPEFWIEAAVELSRAFLRDVSEH